MLLHDSKNEEGITIMREVFQHACEIKLENGRYLPRRFSEKSMDALSKISPMFGKLACCTAGISLKFYTDAKEISFDYKYDILYTLTGGFDVYECGQMVKAITLPTESCEGTFTYKKSSPGKTLIEVFLPSNAEIQLWNLQLGNYHPAPLEQKDLVLYYGDSLTQSAYITNTSLSWVSRVARITGTDYINRGIGSLFYDASYLDSQEKLNPAFVFVEFGGNDLVKHDADHNVVFLDGVLQHCTLSDIPMLEQNANTYLSKIKNMYPAANISVLSHIRGMKPIAPELLEVVNAFNQALQKIAHKQNLRYIDSATILTPAQGYYVADNVHYNAEGNAAFAEGLRPYVDAH